MNLNTDAALALELEAAVRTVPGVVEVYRTGTPVARAIAVGGERLGIGAAPQPLVSIERAGDGIQVEVSLGVSGSVGAGDTVAAATVVLSALLAERGCTAPELRITVVHISEVPGGSAAA